MSYVEGINPILLTDFYKTVHHLAYVPRLDFLTSYWTPRKSRIEGVNKVVMFGLQAVIKEYVIKAFNENFFSKPWEEIEKEYKRIIVNTMSKLAADTSELKKLHTLGYLPISISAIKEGERVNIGVPMIEITNTRKGFGWLVNYLETYLSVNLWHPMTSATIAYEYRKFVENYFEKTVTDGLVSRSCGDFSMRGMTAFQGAAASGGGHLISFVGTSNISAIKYLEHYYNCNCENEVVGIGTPSMEHSVVSSYGKDGEFEAMKHWLTEVFPTGSISIVSDTYDYFKVLTKFLPKLKNEILARDGKTIIRGDSGDPVDIICGKESVAFKGTPEGKGTVEILWDIFGGTVNEKGYKVLNPKIGAIYGDSITLERGEEIFSRLAKKGFASSNCVLGVGSYTYQYVTRDSLGFALKATHAVVDGKEKFIYKDPITDKTENGNFKKSHKGLCVVYKENDDFICIDEKSIAEKNNYRFNELKEVFSNGELLVECSLNEIRERLHNNNFSGDKQ